VSIQSTEGLAISLAQLGVVSSDNTEVNSKKGSVKENIGQMELRQANDLVEFKGVNDLKEKQESDSDSLPTLELEDAVSDINESIQNIQKDIVLAIHEETGESVVRVIDRKTEQVIRQFPAEEVIQAALKLEIMQGILQQ